jgi:hypothetical protein
VLLYGRAGRLSTENGGFRPGQVPKNYGSKCAMPGMTGVHGEGRRMLSQEEDAWLWSEAGGPAPVPETGSVPMCYSGRKR